tara:strand:- start:96 stop:545 length:450 start_codon:yes stop_codon:yes gene_type:complete
MSPFFVIRQTLSDKDKILLALDLENILKIKNSLTCLNSKYVVIIHQLKKNQLLYIFFIYLFILLTPIMALESKDYILIDMLVKSCYKDIESCNKALFKIHNYQKNAAINNKFSCQTRLLGLEANLIMVMNSNLKMNEAKNIINAVKKYC